MPVSGSSLFSKGSQHALPMPLLKGVSMKRDPFNKPALGDRFEFDTDEGTVEVEVVRIAGVVQFGSFGQPVFQVPLVGFADAMKGLRARFVGSKSV